MNSIALLENESFRVGETNLEYYQDRLVKVTGGAFLFCVQGSAEITIDLEKHAIGVNTNVVLLADSILSLVSAAEDFCMEFFAFSNEMMRLACFRLDPSFIHNLKEHPCYTHTDAKAIAGTHGFIKAGTAAYHDTENRFRDSIAQNMLQIFFMNTYDKLQHQIMLNAPELTDRKRQLFKKFIQLMRTHCTARRDVDFYAGELCISPRYLSSITQYVAGKSPKEFIDKFLIVEIKIALQEGNLSAKEISEQYCFPDQSFFGRYFKKHTGMSPTEYKDKWSRGGV